MTDHENHDVLRFLRIGRALVDGATPDWAAGRFGISVGEVNDAWLFTRAELDQYFIANDPEFISLDAYIESRPDRILRVLLHWIDVLGRPAVPESSPTDDGNADPEQKKDTGQGETGD